MAMGREVKRQPPPPRPLSVRLIRRNEQGGGGVVPSALHQLPLSALELRVSKC